MIVNKEFILAAYCEALSTLSHEDALAQVAAQCGQDPAEVARVVNEAVPA